MNGHELRPQLAEDVTLVRRGDGGVLQRTQDGKAVRLAAGAVRLCQLANGERTAQDLTELLRREGLLIDLREVQHVFLTLEQRGFLRGRRSHRRLKWDIRGWLWLARLTGIDHLASAIAHRLQWSRRRLFWRPAVIITGGLAMVGAPKLLAGAAHVRIGVDTVPALAATLIAGMLLHELGHVIVAKWQGARVISIGCGLYYLRPCFGCEIFGFDALNPSARIRISAAGLAVDVTGLMVAAATATFLSPETKATELILLYSVTTTARIVFNLNPLVKLDGYYLFAEALGKPMLREDALRQLQASAKRFLDRSAYVASERQSLTARALLHLYAFASLVYVGALLAIGTVIIRTWFANDDLFVAILAAVVAYVLTNLAVRAVEWRRPSVTHTPTTND